MKKTITGMEMDVIGEIANISMGNAATTLSMMLNQRVTITTPFVEVINRSQALDDYEATCYFVQIHYIEGVEGNNVMILKDRDVKIMMDLMMGGDGSNLPEEVSEMHISCISEAMNQMMGTSATSLSTVLNKTVDISPPTVTSIDVESVKVFEKIFEDPDHLFLKVTFRLTVGDIIDSIMVQLYPISLAKELCVLFLGEDENTLTDAATASTSS
ncbi:MAG: flagellar motor switch phosphatase FliY [Eubacterium sp.]|nr:flagellar motor switch phosphatase FliY [Eubacterium sp.]